MRRTIRATRIRDGLVASIPGMSQSDPSKINELRLEDSTISPTK